jgi:hypothetical protein
MVQKLTKFLNKFDIDIFIVNFRLHHRGKMVKTSLAISVDKIGESI